MRTESDVDVYQALAALHERAGQAALRDRYLVLAADAALTAGRAAEAERLRQQLLRHSRSHLLGPYPSYVQAQNTPDVQLLVAELRRSCPPKEARRLLEAMRNGSPPAPAPKRPTLPPTSSDLSVELDSAWLPEADAKAGSGDLLERTGDIDVAAALGEEPAPARTDRPRPAPPAPAAPSRPQPAPPANRPLAPTAARPALPRIQPAPLAPPAPEAGPAQPHAWVATLLAVVVIGIGLALAAYSLAKPFVP